MSVERDEAAADERAGRPGDFDFLTGDWRIRNRRLIAEPDTWDEFDGESTCTPIMGGVGSVEDLRIPAREFAGMGLRLLDRKTGVWIDHWVNAKLGDLTLPGMPGGFSEGVGTFEVDDMDGETPIKVRCVWDRITPRTCRWRQWVSRVGGDTWVLNWSMDWVRA